MVYRDAASYINNNQPQRKGGLFICDHHFHRIKWRKGERILDVGTADGSFLLLDLYPKIPLELLEWVVGVDSNEELINYAKQHSEHSRYKKFRFYTLEADTEVIPREFPKNFDHIFSFFSLHWVQNQGAVFKNLFAMMKPGANMLLTMISRDIPSRVHEEMKGMSQWAPFMTDYDNYKYSYYDSVDPKSEVEKHLAKSGFVSYDVQIDGNAYCFDDLNKFWGFCCAINPFIKNIPPAQQEMYKRDYINAARHLDRIVFEREGKIRMGYGMIIIYGEKPGPTAPEAGAPGAGASGAAAPGAAASQAGAPEAP